MGTHPSGPSKIIQEGDTTELLSDFLSTHSFYIGKVPAGYNDNDLPFLFKVLSIKTALSIQVIKTTISCH
jgi:mannose-6-phosphate isomerase